MFKCIGTALDKLHGNSIVHSDVRPDNMLFLQDGTAKIIDFDLAGEVDTTYPINYNSVLAYRHDDAQPGKPRKKIHDRYSFLCIVKSAMILTHSQKEHLDTLTKEEKTLATLFE